MTADGPIHLDEALTRAKFEELTSDLLERTKKPFRDVMSEAGVTVSEIDHVVLVGGSTRPARYRARGQRLTLPGAGA